MNKSTMPSSGTATKGDEASIPDHLFKLVLVGDTGVGKTSLLIKYVDDVFTDTFISTFGVDIKVKTLEQDGKKVKFQIWGTAGQDRFRNIVSPCYRGAHAILIVYDITDMTSLQSVTQWHSDIDRYNKDARRVLVGNKCDLHAQRQVTEQEARALAERLNMTHVETSAKTAQNLHALFADVIRMLLADFNSYKKPPPSFQLSSLFASRTAGSICNC